MRWLGAEAPCSARATASRPLHSLPPNRSSVVAASAPRRRNSRVAALRLTVKLLGRRRESSQAADSNYPHLPRVDLPSRNWPLWRAAQGKRASRQRSPRISGSTVRQMSLPWRHRRTSASAKPPVLASEVLLRIALLARPKNARVVVARSATHPASRAAQPERRVPWLSGCGLALWFRGRAPIVQI